MKKHLKKIILIISLFCVIVTSMTLPTLAYTISEKDMVTWKDYMGEDGLYYALMGKDISKNSYAYYYDYSDTQYLIMQTLKPTDFGNYATYNGAFSFKFANSLEYLKDKYHYNIGYFDFRSTNRCSFISSLDGNLEIYVFDANTCYSHYTSGINNFYDLPFSGYIKNQLDDYIEAGEKPSTNEKFVFTLISKGYYEQFPFNLFMGVCIYPSIPTAENLYREILVDLIVANNNKNALQKDLDYWMSEYEMLDGALNDTEQRYLELWEQYTKYEDNLNGLKDQVSDLENRNESLQNTNTQLNNTIKNKNDKITELNQTNKDLKEALGNTNALTKLGNGIGQGFTNILEFVSNLGVGGLTVGACITVAVVIFVVFVIIKLVLR